MRNIKYISLVVCLVAILGLFIGVGKNTFTKVTSAQNTPSAPTQRSFTETEPIPEEITYLVLFQEAQELKEKDAQNQATSQPTSFKNSFYQDRLALDSSQSSSVDSIAADALAQIQSVDQRAKQVIDQYRSQYPNGELRKIQPSASSNGVQSARPQRTTEPLPPAPSELGQLQNQKNQIILAAKQSIQQTLGGSKFTEFDALVKKNATRILLPLNLGTHQPQPFQTPN